MPAPGMVLAGLDFRLSMLEKAVACALEGAPGPGTVYVALMEAAAELREFRPTAGILKALAAEVEDAVRASVAAEQAAEAAARARPDYLRVVSG